ncbi:MAG: Fic family protein [Deltaproteobacteria bacterium]|nr:Fic family protein [Deltaproteobacteria bacterium]
MPYEPKYTITTHLMGLIESISSMRTKIDISPISLAWIPRLTKEAFSRMAHSSTAIEGNPLTLREVRILSEGGTLPHTKPRYVQEIFNYFAALKHVSDNNQKEKILEGDALKLHVLIGKDALDREPVGSYRTYQVYVGGHKPPKAADVPKLMKELLEWLNTKGRLLPAVISSAILHYQFEYIHPFGDGNGRVGRVLATWELYRKGLDTHHIFSVDEVYWENRQRYYNALDLVRKQKGDLTGWLEFIAEAVELSLERALQRVESIRALKEDNKPLILLPKQEKLLHLIKSSPLSIKEIQSELKVTKSGAHFLIKPLIEANLIKRVGGHKAGKYIIT